MGLFKKIIIRITTKKTNIGDIYYNHFDYIGRRAYILKNGEVISGEIKHRYMCQDDDIYFMADNGENYVSDTIYVSKR